jgi:hypothetical protein
LAAPACPYGSAKSPATQSFLIQLQKGFEDKVEHAGQLRHP